MHVMGVQQELEPGSHSLPGAQPQSMNPPQPSDTLPHAPLVGHVVLGTQHLSVCVLQTSGAVQPQLWTPPQPLDTVPQPFAGQAVGVQHVLVSGSHVVPLAHPPQLTVPPQPSEKLPHEPRGKSLHCIGVQQEPV